MRIGIYAETACDLKPTGIGLHVRELLRALSEIDRQNTYLVYYPAGLQTAGEALAGLQLGGNFRPRPVRFPRNWHQERPRVWWQWYLPWVLRRDRVDVFHGPNHFVPRYRRGRVVVTIHDLAFFKMTVHGERLDAIFRDWVRRALAWSDAVIALSQNTRRDVEGLGVLSDNVRVIYGGGNVTPESEISYDRASELRAAFNLPEKYVLFVGTLQPRKNVPFLVRAFADLKKRHSLPHKLVLAGHRDSATAEIESLARSLGIADDIIITGYVEAWQMPLLYKLADVFVLPTLYEGFTLVTLEAMSYGTPVIATETSSIREGVGDAAVLVPVNDVDRLSGAMATVLTDPELRGSLIERGKTRAQLFTWQQCARQTLELYRDLHEGREASRGDEGPRSGQRADAFQPV
jgi:glycosyltransferase involved in cell wall biosynthesis